MRILIVEQDKNGTGAIAEALRSAEREVAFADAGAAIALIRSSAPDVLLFFWPAEGGVTSLRALCAADARASTYVIAVLPDDANGRFVHSALAAGAHDIARVGADVAELRARVDVRARMRRWIPAMIASIVDETKQQSLSTLRAWNYLGTVVADDLEVMLGRRAQVIDAWLSSGDQLQRAATIALSLPSEKFEIRVSVIADDETLRQLGAELFGDAPVDNALLSDLMRELANTAGGAVKRSALPEHITLTAGLPIDGTPPAACSSIARGWTIAFEGAAAIGVVGEICRHENERVPPQELKEGMIVVNDTFGKGGMLLAKGGTRLTLTTAQKLANLLDHRLLIEVVEGA